MNFNELKNAIIPVIDAGIAIEMKSAPGRGKSEFVRQLVEHLSKRDGEEWGFATLFLATQTPPDLIGYQFKGTVTYGGKEYSVTDPTLPTWFMTEAGLPVFAYKRGILLLDEFGQGQTDVKAAAAELLLNGRIGPHKLSDGWVVIACSNRQGDRSGVTKSLDFVINRRAEVEITDDLDSWNTWAATAGVMPLTVAFANQHPHIVFADGVPEKQGPWCTPRSLVMADRYMQAAGSGGELPDAPQNMEIVGGMIGQAAAAQLFAFVRLEKEMPKYDTIVNRPKEAKVPTAPDAQMLVCYNLAHRVSAKDAGAVITYVERLGKEFAVTFAKQAVRRDHSLVATPAFNKWALENSSLMAAIANH